VKKAGVVAPTAPVAVAMPLSRRWVRSERGLTPHAPGAVVDPLVQSCNTSRYQKFTPIEPRIGPRRQQDMTAPPSPSAPLHISTDAFPAHRRLALWREIYGRTIGKFDIEPINGQPFRADVTLRSLPGLGIAAGERSDASYRVTPELAAKSPDNLIFAVVTKGTGTISQRGREATITAGEALLMSATEPSISTLQSGGGFLTLVVPREVISPMVVEASSMLVRPIPRNTEALRLITSYLGVLREADTLSEPELQRKVVTHIHDLLASALGATQNAALVAQERGIRSARLRAIMFHIIENLFNRELSVTGIALRFNVTPRYIQKLFESEGMTFTEYVLERRLLEANRLLNDSGAAERSIADVAFKVGFGDLSYFNRTFRRRFGMTPSDARQQARPDSGETQPAWPKPT
jgi:AraC-like DNA-binding protein